MKFKDALWKAYKGMGRSISRYPLTVVFDCGRSIEQLHDRKSA